MQRMPGRGDAVAVVGRGLGRFREMNGRDS
jgi:hypothetical protein